MGDKPMNKKYKENWSDYYNTLEGIRKTGIVNMFGAAPYLEQAHGLGEGKAQKVLTSWMENYDQLVEDGVISR